MPLIAFSPSTFSWKWIGTWELVLIFFLPFFRFSLSGAASTALLDEGAADVVRVEEGDTAKFKCSTSPWLSGVDWFKDGARLNPREHKRVRYSKKKGIVSVEYIESKDAGQWSIRPKSRPTNDPAAGQLWCNFTLVVQTDDDEDAGLMSDQAGGDDVGATLEDEEGLFYPEGGEEEEDGLEDEEDEYTGSSTPGTVELERPPFFRRIKNMESVQSMVKPAGSTVTYKCPAEGNVVALLSFNFCYGFIKNKIWFALD